MNDLDPSIKFEPTPDAPEYISDPEYISKIINNFIMNEDDDATVAVNKKQLSDGQQYNRRHVIKALTKLQLTFRPKYAPGQTININTDEFKSALMNSMAKLDNVSVPKLMNQLDSRTIDFIEMIFSAFLRDRNISDTIKELLLLMQIPIIKTALLDNKLFNNDKHPARSVLNSIARLGIGIEDKENKIYKTMKYIIEQLLQSFDDKLDVFMVAKLSLDRLHDIQLKEHVQTEKQAQQELTREYTRQLVLTELQYYIRNRDIPKRIQPLILSHWATLMYQRFVSFGKESIEWREAIGILRLLSKTLKPIKSRDDWLALRSIYKGIVNSVRSCLENVQQNKEKMFVATSNLNNYYTSKLSESEFSVSDEDITEISSSESESYNIQDYFNDTQVLDVNLSPLEKEAEASSEIIENMPDVIVTNAWFEVFSDYSHPVRRLKLSVILKEKARLVFVDFMGNKVIEKSLKKFITELKNDQSRPINDHSIFEYALSMVIISIAVRE
jgi:Protein of unknown function (DUF1631)